MTAEWSQLATVGHLVVALDLDGTLIPFFPTPAEARIDGDTLALLEALVALPDVTVGVISGRPRAMMSELTDRFGGRLALAAEHGVWRFAEGAWSSALPPIPALDEIRQQLAALAAQFPGALVERKTCSVCFHFRAVAPALHPAVSSLAETLVDEWLEIHPDLERLPVSEALEVRHTSAHKGNALAWLRSRAPAGATVLAIGDDITDEDLFVGLREQDIGVLVAETGRRTQASLRLPSPASVHRFLRWLTEARKRTQQTGAALDDLVPANPPRAAQPARLVVASNRLPAVPSGDRKREVGGLVSALLPALSEAGGIWLGWSGAEREPGVRLRVEDGDSFTRADFDYPPGWRQNFYVGFCNQSLWPLLHGFPTRVRYVDEEWRCYQEANKAYAELALSAGGPMADVWIQDFHLMLTGRDLRHAGHKGRLGFFLHVPFPPLDVFETMPWAAEVMSALLDFDRIGVHTQRWADNLIATARGLFGADGEMRARERVRINPVGIDPDRFAEAATRPPPPELGSIDRMLAGRKLILGVDRLDYSKGIPERLEAFAKLFERYPQWRGQVSFVQVSVPTRSEVPEYAELRSRVEYLVGRINGTFGEADWVPVRYLYRSYDQDTLAHLYREAAVGLVTPLRDGMNLVAKEFVASQDPANPGVLVLSKFCGAAERMPLAQLTNPYHVDGVADDLHAALQLGLEDRVARHAALRATVWQDTASAWATSFLADLRA